MDLLSSDYPTIYSDTEYLTFHYPPNKSGIDSFGYHIRRKAPTSEAKASITRCFVPTSGLGTSYVRCFAPRSQFGRSNVRRLGPTLGLRGFALTIKLSRMGDNTTNPSAAESTSQPQTPPSLPVTCPANAADFFAALGNPLRWKMMQFLAAGEVLSASHMAQKLGRDFDGVSKHLKLMRNVGLICTTRGEDKRYDWYYVPKQCRAEPGVLNYGWCRFVLGSKAAQA